MTFYNAGLERDITLSTFGYALTHMWPEVIGAFIAQRYIASPVVKRLVSRLFTQGEYKPIFIILATAGFTVSMMAPMMTLYVSIYHMGLTPGLLDHWLTKLIQNFPFALCAQIFYVGPLVRLIFRTLFKKTTGHAEAHFRISRINTLNDIFSSFFTVDLSPVSGVII